MTELPRDEGQNPVLETGVQARADAPELPADELQTPWRGDWGHPELSRVPEAEPPVMKERLFSRKVLVGWALLTLPLYFGVRLVVTTIKETVRQSVTTRTHPRASSSGGNVVIMLPNGKRITIGENGAEVTTPQVPLALPARKADANFPARPALPASKASDLPPGSQKR